MRPLGTSSALALAVTACAYGSAPAADRTTPDGDTASPVFDAHPGHLAGIYTTGPADAPDDVATHDQRLGWIWLRPDGAYLDSAPDGDGWRVARGRWRAASSSEVIVAAEETARGFGGGMEDGQVLGVVCAWARASEGPVRFEVAPDGALTGRDGGTRYRRWEGAALPVLRQLEEICARPPGP